MKPLRFCLVGSGQVFAKYWIPASESGDVDIAGIISLESPDEFATIYPKFSKIYRQTSSIDKTIKILTEISNYDVIALLVPANIRLELLIVVINNQNLSSKKIFIEKPFTRNYESIDIYRELIEKHFSRLHFAGKYVYGRADILLKQLLRIESYPLFIDSIMIEGSNYFDVVGDSAGKSLYVIDGPELDIGYHMLSIVSAYFRMRRVPVEKMSINENTVMDLNNIRPYFIPNFGYAAEVNFNLQNGMSIPMFMQVGKADSTNERHIDFEFKDKRIIQEFTSLSADDPVYLIQQDTRRKLVKHRKDYLYYSKELREDIFCQQSKSEQNSMLDILQICLQLKELRLKKTIV